MQTLSVSAKLLHLYFMLLNLMRNWSLENVSDGYGRNLVQVYVSILSITLVQQLGHSLGYGELLQLACWISLPLASASVSSLWSYFENELCWEGILVLRASSVFDSMLSQESPLAPNIMNLKAFCWWSIFYFKPSLLNLCATENRLPLYSTHQSCILHE